MVYIHVDIKDKDFQEIRNINWQQELQQDSRPITTDYDRLANDKQPEAKKSQPKWQQELQQELKDLLNQGFEHEQRELQQEFKNRPARVAARVFLRSHSTKAG